MTSNRIVRIGGGSAFFVDSALSVPQLLEAEVDYIILDYLAEGTMGLLGRAKIADPQGGFPSDFLDVHIGPFLKEIAARGTRIISNAGGVNPQGLAARLRKRIARLGLNLVVGCMAGDCLLNRIDDYSAARDMFNGTPLPPRGITSASAYLGAFPIAQMIVRGADIVITGRVVDSALALGPLIAEFGWRPTDLDCLAGGTVAGHLIECGAQVTGGTFTDWRDVPGWANIGSPIAECFADGRCVITKPKGTGGLVSFGTVAEQLLYETGNPKAYVVPDVTCDFTTLDIREIGRDRVLVSNATGHPPPERLKACVTWDDGWRAVAYQPVIGPAAAEKARKQAEALFERGRAMLRNANLSDWSRTECVLIGSGEELVAKLIVEHPEMSACQMFAREQFAAISAMAPGTSVAFGVQVQPCAHLMSFLVSRDEIVARIDVGGGFEPCDPAAAPGANGGSAAVPPPRSDARAVVPVSPAVIGEDANVGSIAYVRSGEKGETINIGVIARQAEFLPVLRSLLTPARLRAHFPDLGDFEVAIYDVDGIHALNLVLDGALPGGINASQRLDPAAKSIGQRLTSLKLRPQPA